MSEHPTTETGSRFQIIKSPLEGLLAVVRKPRTDSRGWLERLYCSEELAAAGFATPPLQINRSCTKGAGTIRGMHFQSSPHCEVKFVSCTVGEVFDVAVDLRPRSRTFLKWFGVHLSAENRTSLLIPVGFAHGFQVLSPDAELLYLHSTPHAPHAEGGLNPLDPAIAIEWPLPPGAMSDKDKQRPFVGDGFAGVVSVS